MNESMSFLNGFLGANGVFFAEPGPAGRRPVSFANAVATAAEGRRLLARGIPLGIDMERLTGTKGRALGALVLGLAGLAVPVLLRLPAAMSPEAHDLLAEMTEGLGAQLHLALYPGHGQDETSRMMDDLTLELRRMPDGVQVLLPMQKGSLDPDELLLEAQSLLGREVVPNFGLDSTEAEVEAFVAALQPPQVHLSGQAPRRKRLALAARIWDLAPELKLSEARDIEWPLEDHHPDAGQFPQFLAPVRNLLRGGTPAICA